MFTALRGIVVAILFISLWFWFAISVRRYDSMIPIVLPHWSVPVGWILGISGALLSLSCVAVFATRGRGTPAPFDPPQVFVATGPYRYVRNPMYIGAIAVLIGSGLIVRSTSILLLALAFWLIAHLFVIFYEEPSLERRFGESYTRYKQQIKRWLPGIAR